MNIDNDILDLEFEAGDFAELIALDEDGDDVSVTVRIQGSFEDDYGKWYLVCAPREELLNAGLELELVDSSYWGFAHVQADELDPSDTTTFIKIAD